MSGIVSSAQEGVHCRGRERQFFYVNRRPCQLLQLQSALNNAFRAAADNSSFPVIVCSVQTSSELDFNASVDKRMIFIPDEDAFIENIKVIVICTQSS